MTTKLSLPASVASPQDLGALTADMREYAKWLAHESVKKKVGAKTAKSTPPDLSPAANELLQQQGEKEKNDHKSIEDLIKTLEDYGKHAPSITVTLAAPPTSGIKKTMVAWCRENIDPNVLVNFQFNRTLLGGMVVRSGSHVFDWSFRRRLLAERDKFPEALRNVR